MLLSIRIQQGDRYNQIIDNEDERSNVLEYFNHLRTSHLKVDTVTPFNRARIMLAEALADESPNSAQALAMAKADHLTSQEVAAVAAFAALLSTDDGGVVSPVHSQTMAEADEAFQADCRKTLGMNDDILAGLLDEHGYSNAVPQLLMIDPRVPEDLKDELRELMQSTVDTMVAMSAGWRGLFIARQESIDLTDVLRDRPEQEAKDLLKSYASFLDLAEVEPEELARVVSERDVDSDCWPFVADFVEDVERFIDKVGRDALKPPVEEIAEAA